MGGTGGWEFKARETGPVQIAASMRRLSALSPASGLLPALLAAACATTGATLGSGVGDAHLEHPPFYAGASLASLDPTRSLGYLPVAYQRGGSQAPIFDPSLSEPMARLLAEMNAFLDALDVGTRLAEGGQVSAVTHAATRVPPDVQFGCETESGAPDDECADRGEGALGRGSQPMRLAVGRPSAEWVVWVEELMTRAGTAEVLVVTLEVGQYWIRQRGWQGTKEIELGTDYVGKFPWLTSLETPVSVVQLTGALVDKNGKAIRIGAEGLIARRTSLPISSVGGQALITDREIEDLRTVRREDLADRPLVWQAGLCTLVTRVTGRTSC